MSIVLIVTFFIAVGWCGNEKILHECSACSARQTLAMLHRAPHHQCALHRQNQSFPHATRMAWPHAKHIRMPLLLREEVAVDGITPSYQVWEAIQHPRDLQGSARRATQAAPTQHRRPHLPSRLSRCKTNALLWVNMTDFCEFGHGVRYCLGQACLHPSRLRTNPSQIILWAEGQQRRDLVM